MNDAISIMLQCQAHLNAMDLSIDTLDTALRKQDLDAVMAKSSALHSLTDQFAVSREQLLIAVGGHEAPFAESLISAVGKDEAENFLKLSETVSQKQQTVASALQKITTMNFKLLSAIRGNGQGTSVSSYGANGIDQNQAQELGFSTSA